MVEKIKKLEEHMSSLTKTLAADQAISGYEVGYKVGYSAALGEIGKALAEIRDAYEQEKAKRLVREKDEKKEKVSERK